MANTKPKSSQVVYGKNSQPTVESALDSLQSAFALANTFTTVPLTNQGAMVVVTLPHLRFMVWNGTKYVRAPWHQPGTIRHVMRGLRPGELEVRADVTLQKADFPDLAEYLGVVGATFVLDEARGEFLRSLDSGRGKDSGRGVGTSQGDAGRNLKGGFTVLVPGSHGNYAVGAISASATTETSVTTNPALFSVAPGAYNVPERYGYKLDASTQWPTAGEFRVTNRAYRLAVTY